MEIFLKKGLDKKITKQPVRQIAASRTATISQLVITGLDPVIHLLQKKFCEDGWMPGSSPGMTINSILRRCEERSDEAIHPPSPKVWIASLRSQ
jgi:hypothetical protein